MDKCHCGAEPSVFLNYSNAHLCQQHFIHMFDKRFRATVRNNQMIKKNDRVAIGLSGGKDSMVLLHSLAELKKDLPFELVAITIDEGIKGYREKTIKVAKAECVKLGVEHFVFSYEKEAGKTMDEIVSDNSEDIPCSHCGVMRRYLLNRSAREVNATKMATGHNLDDMAQTIMMNIMRNEPARLARLNEPMLKDAKFVQRIRPLMVTPEREVAIYAIMKDIELERMECPYARFAFRGHIRKMINEAEEKYPGTKFKIVNSLLEMEDALRAKYSKGAVLSACEKCGEPSSSNLCMYCKTVKFVNRKLV
ncbi:TIGR00269 family protein [Candidatus Micrarchaeota archaeon]|nr:TIGR00269 family protein [Candidatus Micrarchaeota archaeon]